jgi:hypothetical protein
LLGLFDDVRPITILPAHRVSSNGRRHAAARHRQITCYSFGNPPSPHNPSSKQSPHDRHLDFALQGAAVAGKGANLVIRGDPENWGLSKINRRQEDWGK